MSARLTKRGIDAATPSADGKERYLWCNIVPGFGVRINPGGAKSYIVQFRDKRGRFHRVKIGSTQVLGVDDARMNARDLLTKVITGEEWKDQKHARGESETLTVGQLCDLYVEHSKVGLVRHKGKALSETTQRRDRGRIARHIKPMLSHIKVNELTRARVAKMHDDIFLGKVRIASEPGKRRNALVTGGPGTARKSVFLVSAMYRYARSKGYVTIDNPCTGIEVTPDGKRTRFLKPEEYVRLGQSLSRHGDLGVSRKVAKIIWAWALTGFRHSEVVRLEPEELTIVPNGIYLKKSKVGPGMRAVGTIPLAMLRAEAKDKTAWVFQAEHRERHLTNIDPLLKRVTADAGLEGVTAHTLRHSFATYAGTYLGYSELYIAALLAHSKGSVTSTYVHIIDKPLAEAADHVSREIAQLMGFEQSGMLANEPHSVEASNRLIGPAAHAQRGHAIGCRASEQRWRPT